MNTLQGPAVLEQPFCASGDKNTIPSAATGSQLASLAEGFPEVTQKAIAEGGIPPERKDFNGALNLMSQFYYAFQNGWLPTFDQDVSDTIGGYAEGAVLWYMPSTGTYANQVVALRSLVGNNTYNFNQNASYIGTYWGVVDITTRADTSLSNLTSTGKNIGNWSTNVTNCITAIPQDITLTLSGGTLTLKSGSKVYVPNGSGVFDTVTTSADCSLSSAGSLSTDVMIFYRNGSLFYEQITACSSGTTSLSGTGFYYNTSNNTIKYYSSGTAGDSLFSFPIAVIERDSGTITAIKKVFNGFGFIGSTVFVLPGVKGLVPNGRNSDGTAKSTSFEVGSVLTNSGVYASQNNVISITSNAIASSKFYYQTTQQPSTTGTLWYHPQENKMYRINNSGVNGSFGQTPCIVISVDSNSVITGITSATSFQAVDYSLYQNTPHIIETYHNGTSWYRVWSDGFCEQGGQFTPETSGDTTSSVTFLKEFKDTNYQLLGSFHNSSVGNPGVWPSHYGCAWGTKSTTGFTRLTYQTSYNWEAKGYIF